MSKITGTKKANVLIGTNNSDTIYGLEGKDTITGGLGKDTMSGGADADKFIINYGDSFSKVPSASAFDVITDFSKAQGDTIHITNQDGTTAHIASNVGFTNTANMGKISGFSITNGMLSLHSDGPKGSHPVLANVATNQGLAYAQANAALLPHDAVVGIHTPGHTLIVDNHSGPGYTIVDLIGSGANLTSLAGVIV